MPTEIKPVKFSDWIRQEVRESRFSGECTCGRLFGTLFGKVLTYQSHCPKCGSGWTIAVASLDRIVDYHEMWVICKGHRCRKCGHEFHDGELFEHCEAGPTREMQKRKLQEQQQAQAAEQALGMPVDKFKEEINRLRVARGEEPL